METNFDSSKLSDLADHTVCVSIREERERVFVYVFSYKYEFYISKPGSSPAYHWYVCECMHVCVCVCVRVCAVQISSTLFIYLLAFTNINFTRSVFTNSHRKVSSILHKCTADIPETKVFSVCSKSAAQAVYFTNIPAASSREHRSVLLHTFTCH